MRATPWVLVVFAAVSAGCSPAEDWVEIAGGTFSMGGEIGEGDQLPIHDVDVPDFEIWRTEVTVSQYEPCVDEGVCEEPASGWDGANWGVFGHGNYPINNLTWAEAAAFCEWVGGRLPSEAEWEYAARSLGQDRDYPWGDEEPTCERAVMHEDEVNGCGKDHTWAVCSKVAGNTEQGLCDMAGNVSEWVEDRYHETYDGAPDDGSAWVEGNRGRVQRGGAILNTDSVLSTTYRTEPMAGQEYWGVRCAR